MAPAIWGGDALVHRYGKPGDASARLGESWECWDENVISSGAFAGERLADLRVTLGAELMGPADPAQRFPILTKIIDAREPLSVQVHPDDGYAQRVEHQPVGKTECWYILDAKPGSELVLGWTHNTDRAEYERRVADGTLGDILRRVPVKRGDVFYLPAGTLHAIGAGIQLFETQQASDLTYRIFDWNRVGDDGKPRELHVAKAADVLDFSATMPGAAKAIAFATDDAWRNVVIADRRFSVERFSPDAAGGTIETGDCPLAVMAMDAAIQLDFGGNAVPLAPWQTAVVPASAGRVKMTSTALGSSALITRVQPDLARLRADAATAGLTKDVLGPFFAQFG